MPTITTPNSIYAAARAAGKPWALGTNALRRRNEEPIWVTGGTWSGTDLTADGHPTSFAMDGDLGDYTCMDDASAQAVDTVYFMLNLESGTTFEHVISAAMIRFDNADTFAPAGANNPIAVSIQFSLNNAFSSFTGLPSGGTVVSFSWPATNAKLIGSSLLGAAGFPALGVYTEVQWARVRIHTTNGNFLFAPRISELVLGASRQFAHNPREPHDPSPLESGVEDFPTRNGGRCRNIEYERLARFPFRFKVHDNNPYGIAEDAMFRQLLADTRGMTRPYLWVDQPVGSTFDGGRATGIWGQNPDPRMPAKYVNATATEIEFEFHELPPGQAKTEDFTAVSI